MAITIKLIQDKITQADKLLQGERDRLAGKLLAGANANDLNDILQGIARAEGQVKGWATAAAVIKAGETDAVTVLKVAEQEAIAQIAAAGADDTWSGRGNDTRRAKFDGLLTFLQDVRLKLEVA